jgi:hypothetical protein
MKKDGTDPQTEEERVEAVLHLLPEQDAPNTSDGHRLESVKRGRGRPRKIERKPTTSDLEYHAEMVRARQTFITSDPLVKKIEDKGDPLEVLYLIKKEVASEAASLSFERLEAAKRGKDTGQVSTRRIEALKKIADIELKIKEIDSESINLSSERMQKLFTMWVETMREVAQETVPEEVLDLFFNRFATAMEGWEERATNALR